MQWGYRHIGVFCLVKRGKCWGVVVFIELCAMVLHLLCIAIVYIEVAVWFLFRTLRSINIAPMDCKPIYCNVSTNDCLDCCRT